MGKFDANVSAKNAAISPSKSDESNKSEANNAKPRKFVVVKNIDSINASVANTERKQRAEISSKVSSTSTAESEVPVQKGSSQSKSSAAARISFLLSKPSTSCVEKSRKSVDELTIDTASSNDSKMLPQSNDQFDLDKVKDEPVDLDADEPISDEPIVDKHIIRPAKSVQPSLPVPSKTAVKRAGDGEVSSAVKKLKPDSNLRSVNISENVTLSVVNQAPSADSSKVRVVSVQKQMPVKKMLQANAANYLLVEGNKETPVQLGRPAKLVPSTGKVVGSSRSQVKILPRPPSQTVVSHTNGPVNVSPATATVKSSVTPTASPLNVDSTSKTLPGIDECLFTEVSEFRCWFF